MGRIRCLAPTKTNRGGWCAPGTNPAIRTAISSPRRGGGPGSRPGTCVICHLIRCGSAIRPAGGTGTCPDFTPPPTRTATGRRRGMATQAPATTPVSGSAKTWCGGRRTGRGAATNAGTRSKNTGAAVKFWPSRRYVPTGISAVGGIERCPGPARIRPGTCPGSPTGRGAALKMRRLPVRIRRRVRDSSDSGESRVMDRGAMGRWPRFSPNAFEAQTDERPVEARGVGVRFPAKARPYSSVGEERLPDEEKVWGSNPCADTRRRQPIFPSTGLLQFTCRRRMVLCPNGQGPVCKTGDAGSSPVGASALVKLSLVEHLPCKQEDAGSIPVASSAKLSCR